MGSGEGDGGGGLELMEYGCGVGRALLSGGLLQSSWLRWDGPRGVFPALSVALVGGLGVGIWKKGGGRVSG